MRTGVVQVRPCKWLKQYIWMFADIHFKIYKSKMTIIMNAGQNLRVCNSLELLRKIFVPLFLSVVFITASAEEIPSGLPVVYITTADSTPVVGREWHEKTVVKICKADGSVDYYTSDASVKAHGNSSFNKPKKPLTLKFDKPVSVLGMTVNKKWFFVSNFMDHSLLRNSLALTVARQTSMAWSSDWRLVNVVENGKYIGCYLIGEEIYAGKDWVDTDVQSGFLVELDSYPNDEYRFETAIRKLPVNIRYPKRPSKEFVDYIQGLFNNAEKALYWTSHADHLLNLDSFVDYYIVYELCQNAEPNGPRSCYMFLGKDGKLNSGPVWDFDLAFENMGLDSGGDIRPERFHLKNVRALTVDSLYDSKALWYDALLKDSLFRNRLAEHWNMYRPRFISLADSLDKWKRIIGPSALADQAMWGAKDPARFDNTGSFETSFENLRKTFMRRIEVLDGYFNKKGK